MDIDTLQIAESFYARGEYKQAFECYRNAALEGDVEAAFKLGLMYENGVYVKQDYASAKQWYVIAAGKGHAEARKRFVYVTKNIRREKPVSVSESQKEDNDDADVEDELPVDDIGSGIPLGDGTNNSGKPGGKIGGKNEQTPGNKGKARLLIFVLLLLIGGAVWFLLSQIKKSRPSETQQNVSQIAEQPASNAEDTQKRRDDSIAIAQAEQERIDEQRHQDSIAEVKKQEEKRRIQDSIKIANQRAAANNAQSNQNVVAQKTEDNRVDNSNIYNYYEVDVAPEFPGGDEALRQYLAGKVKANYPNIAKQFNIEGKVTVSFVIDTNGKVTQAKITNRADPSFDGPALRFVQEMPKWTPGTYRGKKVKVSHSVIINFVLNH